MLYFFAKKEILRSDVLDQTPRFVKEPIFLLR